MKKFLLVPVFFIAVIFASCKNQNSANLTRMSIKMTDAPGAYDALYLNVKEVQVITSDGQSTMEVNSKPFDILKFRLGKDTLLASKDIPSGTIEQIRLVLNDTGNRVVVDGKSFDLTTPSGQTSGIKLNVHDELISGVAYTMTLDFDAAKSIVKTGNGKYILKPVIRAIASAVSEDFDFLNEMDYNTNDPEELSNMSDLGISDSENEESEEEGEGEEDDEFSSESYDEDDLQKEDY